jgi:hypothetical protein
MLVAVGWGLLSVESSNPLSSLQQIIGTKHFRETPEESKEALAVFSRLITAGVKTQTA